MCRSVLLSIMLLNAASAFSSSGSRSDLRRTSTTFYSSSISRRIEANGFSSRTREQVPVVTRLQFRDADEEDSSERQQEHKTAAMNDRWWSVWFTPSHPDPVDDQQAVVDDYLDFLERRYARLHENEMPKEKFSAWKWLKQDEVQSDQAQKDALHVLGVAGLASERLLQKYQRAALVQEQAQTLDTSSNSRISSRKYGVSDSKILDAVTVSHKKLFSLPRTVMSKTVTLLQLFIVQRSLFLNSQRQQLRSAVAFLAASVSDRTAKAARALWHVGGGRKNVTWTMTVMAAFVFLLIRPLAQSVSV